MEIRPIKKSEWEKLQDFNAREYRPGHILTNKTYYDWQFDNVFSPATDDYSSLGLFDRAGQIAGTIGVFPAPCSFFGRTVNCHWLANLMVKKELRNLGYGYLLLDQAARGADVAVDHNINDSAWPLFIKSGWRGGDIKRWVGVLDVVAAKQIISRTDAGDLKTLQELSDKFDSAWSFEKIDRLGNDFDRFWAGIRERYPISIDRSSRYLNWRFADNPLTPYSMFATQRNNHLESLAVLRIEDITEGEGHRPSGLKIGRIVDFVSTPGAEEYTLSKLMEFCRNQKLALVDFFGTGDFGRQAMERIGFGGGDVPPYNLIPTLLNPIDRVKRTKHNFAFKVMSQLYKNTESENLDNWYTVKSCGDQDRPY